MNNKNKQLKEAPINKDSKFLNFFLNLLSTISLAWMVWAIYTIYIQIINYYTQDIADIFVKSYIDVSMRYGIASLIVVFPIYLVVVNILHSKYKKNELKKDSFTYRLFTYFILLVSVLFFIFYLVQFINNFLNGIISVAVSLSFLLLLLIIILTFSYYFYDLKRVSYFKKSKVSIIFTIFLVIVVLLGLMIGFLRVERPKDSKNYLIDQKMAEIMSEVAFVIVNFYDTNGKIGENLEVHKLVSTNLSGFVEENIEYRKISKEEFELCVNFKTNSYKGEEPPILNIDQPWIFFKSGRQCYKIDAKKMAEKYYNNEETQKEIDLGVQNFNY